MKNHSRLFLFLLLAFLPFILKSQNQEKISSHNKILHQKIKAVSKNEPIDQLMERIDAAHLMLNQFDDKANSEFNTESITSQLPRIQGGLDLVSEVLAKKNQWIDVNNLQMYAVLLNDIELQLKTWKDNLLVSYKELAQMDKDLKSFVLTRDSVFHKMSIDSNFRGLIKAELHGLSEKYGENQDAISASLTRVDKLQASLSSLYYKTIELEDGVYDLNKQYWITVTHKEAPYLWEKSQKVKSDNPINNLASALPLKLGNDSLKGQKIILDNYFLHNKTDYILVGILGILFFIWVFINYRKAKKTGYSLKEGILKINYLRPIPLASTLVLVLNITPFLDLDTPTLFFEILQTILILFLTYIFIINWPKKYLIYWLVILALYISYSLVALSYSFSSGGTLFIISLNLISLLIGILFYVRMYKDSFFSPFEKFILIVFILCNIVSIGLNLFSFLSLAEQISYAAIFGLIQAIGLTTGFTILSEGLYLQALSYRTGDTQGVIFEDSKIKKNLSTLFTLLIIVFWFISFTDNLNIFSPIYDGVYSFLGVPRQIGSITFAYGNVILFFLIISIANFIQKFLGFFFGENYNLENQNFKKKGSRLAITRLLLILGGFILAIFASGLPVDRITILIGALGVGIGLGLQSIVNNLVSGIILIFERPFRIGDLVEVGTRKGRIKEIGLRSSKLLTSEGSEVIIPNGDLLSERVVNWTLSNDFARLDFSFKIAFESNIERAKEIISHQLESSPLLLSGYKPDILVESLNDTSMSLKVGVWISNINQADNFRSDFLSQVYEQFKQNNIQLKP